MRTSDVLNASRTDADHLFVILVAPNFSDQMGGEATKSLQIYLELERQGVGVHQVTHDRVKNEIDRSWPGMRVSYVRDTWPYRLAWFSIVFRPAVGLMFQWDAREKISELLRNHPRAIVHYTSPVSPVLPYFPPKGAPVVIGPLNGNIHYPPAFGGSERISYKMRRWLHPLLQFGHRLLFSGKQNADVLLVAGGERTYRSLRMSGCRDEQFVDSIDSGVLDRLRDTPRIKHAGRNLRFVHNGRLVVHKGVDLIIESLLKTRSPVTLEVIGRGPELPRLRELAAKLGLNDRVHFIEWFEDRSKLGDLLRQCRAFVFPSLAEANGIVVQEAMILGLPVIALDWGGPSLLVTHDTGILIQPAGREHVIVELAKAMDQLAEDGDLADRKSAAGRNRAELEGYQWSEIIQRWRRMYETLQEKHRGKVATSRATTGQP